MNVNQEFSGWRTASYSGSGSNCVEVAGGVGKIGVRDSKDRTGGVLRFDTADWTAFLAGLK